MKLVIQRVKNACVTADGEETGRIGLGFLVLVGVMEGDTEDLCGYLAEKTANLRVFTDDQDKLSRYPGRTWEARCWRCPTSRVGRGLPEGAPALLYPGGQTAPGGGAL